MKGGKKGRGGTPKRDGVKLLASPSEGVGAKGDLGKFTRLWGIPRLHLRQYAPLIALDLRLCGSGRNGIGEVGKRGRK